MASSPKYAKPLDELAAQVGIAKATLQKYLRDGAPKPPKTKAALGNWGGKLHAWVRENVGTFQDRQKQSAAAARIANGGEHEVELKKWRAQEAKIRVAEKTRQLVSRKEVVEFAGNAILTVKARLYAMVTKMQSRLENVPGHVVVEELQNEVDDILTAFSEGMHKTHGGTDDEQS